MISKVLEIKIKQDVVISRNSQLSILDENGKIAEQHELKYGTTLLVENNSKVKLGETIATWDPYTRPIPKASGKVKFLDMEEDISVRFSTEDLTGQTVIEVIDASVRPSAERFKSNNLYN